MSIDDAVPAWVAFTLIGMLFAGSAYNLCCLVGCCIFSRLGNRSNEVPDDENVERENMLMMTTL